jgi:hypothetical protein
MVADPAVSNPETVAVAEDINPVIDADARVDAPALKAPAIAIVVAVMVLPIKLIVVLIPPILTVFVEVFPVDILTVPEQLLPVRILTLLVFNVNGWEYPMLIFPEPDVVPIPIPPVVVFPISMLPVVMLLPIVIAEPIAVALYVFDITEVSVDAPADKTPAIAIFVAVMISSVITTVNNYQK